MGLFNVLRNWWSDRGVRRWQRADHPIETGTGVAVNEDVALGQSAYMGGCRALSDPFATIPLELFTQVDGQLIPDIKSRMSRILGVSPNRRMTSQDLWPYVILSLNLRGAFYARKIKDDLGDLMYLIPILPDYVEIEATEIETYIFTVNDPARHGREVLTDDDIFWVHGLSLDGIKPISPLKYHASAVGRGAAAEKYENNVYEKGGLPKTVLTAAGKMSPEASERLKSSFLSQSGGNGTPVLEQGVTIQSLAMSPADMTLLEQRAFTVADIARFLRVPLYMLYIEGAAKGWATHEMQATEFIQGSLAPWADRIEGAIRMQLLPPGQVAKFDFNQMLRGNLQGRIEAYSKANSFGMMSPNEARKKENMAPYPGGDQHTVNGSTMSVGHQPSLDNPEASNVT